MMKIKSIIVVKRRQENSSLRAHHSSVKGGLPTTFVSHRNGGSESWDFPGPIEHQ